MSRFFRLLCCVLCALFVSTVAASAQSCEARVSDLNFGAVSLRAGASATTSGTLTVSCRGALVSPVGACVRFGAGSGGAASGMSPRYMTGSKGSVPYILRPYGNSAANGVLTSVYVSVPVLLGSGSTTIPIYAEVLNSASALSSGSFSSSFSAGSDVELSYGVLSCGLLGTVTPVPGFNVTAGVVESCDLSVGSLNFGQVSGLGFKPADAVASIDMRCTEDTDYTISLGLGTGTGVSDPAYRKLSSGIDTLDYGLFMDSARTQVWGSAPAQQVGGTGNGLTQRFSVFGRIYQGQAPKIGVYTDSVVVTVNY
ncbi:Spore Coat Protein U domain protein [Aquimixticola soesokkakensis]|uniref:Spore Coat Protein U domain protein n=1 Tax=Aquimixticola soesokkakensis TaxID=1519096 RepID=A0A1Y5SP53_9RHOB|nr:spore coat U domain-containing protein [Aquimixticola soesokkakensis]SLN43484.1 Spore Coat Protein U domain protein [Aquimixticola soesokkakensis]